VPKAVQCLTKLQHSQPRDEVGARDSAKGCAMPYKLQHTDTAVLAALMSACQRLCNAFQNCNQYWGGSYHRQLGCREGCAMPYKIATDARRSTTYGRKGCAMPFKIATCVNPQGRSRCMRCRKGCAMPLKLQQQNMVVRHLGSRRATKAVQCL